MLPFNPFSKDKRIRFVRALREEGLIQALKKTKRYLWAQWTGNGLSSLFQSKAKAGTGETYCASIWKEMAEQEAFHISKAPALISGRRKIAMIGDLNLPQCRKYRVEQPQDLWMQKNVDYTFSHYEDVPRAIRLMQDATHLMLYRLSSNPITSMLLYEARRLQLPVMYDLDDPLFSVSAYMTYKNMQALDAEYKTHFVREAPKYLDILNGSDIVSVSTPGMQEHTRLYTQRTVLVRRNFADRQTLEAGLRGISQNAVRAPGDGGFRVGFASGSQGHEVDFAEIQDDLRQFLQADPSRQLVILGYFDKKWLPAELLPQIEYHTFNTYETYVETLASLDCAIMPLANDQFNVCKSGVRVIDASSVAVPSIVGTVSDMAELIDDGSTGHVIKAGASWLPALEDMAADPHRTKKMGHAARTLLENQWSAQFSSHLIDPDIVDWVCK